MNTKYFSFIFTVPSSYMPNVKVVTQYEVNVRYALHWNKKVDVEVYYIKPGMAQHIEGWEELEEEIELAAENDAKQYMALGQHRRSRPFPEPGESPYLDHELYLNETIKR